MSDFKVTDELIDRRLEFLRQRWLDMEDADTGWLTYAEMLIVLRRNREASNAYYESCIRYKRPAPSAREEMRQENAAWN